MKVLLTGLSMAYLSGQPLYVYELARELKKRGHDVQVMSDWTNPMKNSEGWMLKKNLTDQGILTLNWHEYPTGKNYDLIIASEPQSIAAVRDLPDVPVVNVVHSEYECETPLPNTSQTKWYVCIRPSIAAHIVTEHDIPIEKVKVIYNGVDRARFDPALKRPHEHYTVVIPCTLDTLREKFLNDEIHRAVPERRVHIVGMDCFAKLDESPFVTYSPDTFHVEQAMANADEVSGILLGRVNIEAWSMGLPSTIYDPETLEHHTYPPPKDFDKRYNIKNVANQIINLL